MRRRILAAFLVCVMLPWFPGEADAGKPVAPPTFRVEADGFGASQADITAVLGSAAGELWRYFPDCKLEPIVVTRGHKGPITLFKRNERGEIVVQLDTEKTFWSQYSYQFAHELCHVLCGFRDGYQGNKWFEETLCETASLYVMRAMARSWKDSPPYPNWKDYRDCLLSYVDDIIRKRDRLREIFTKGLSGFYQAHKEHLQKNPTDRELNGAMAVVFLHLFEEQPSRWEAVRWLNANPPAEGDTFSAYLQKWHDAAPQRHRDFIRQVADLYGLTLR